MSKVPDNFIMRTLMCSFREKQSYKGYQHVFKGYDVEYLEKTGIMERQPYLRTTTCRWCGKERPIRTRHKSDGTLKYYCYCKKCDPAEVDPSTLLWWKIQRDPFVKVFTETTGIQGELEEMVPDTLWKLGRCKNVPFYLIRDVEQGAELKVLFDILSKHPKSVLVTFLNSTGESLDALFSNPIVVFETITSFNEEGHFTFDRNAIEKCMESEVAKKTKSLARRGNRMSNFEKLIKELEEHVVSCYAYIQETAQRGEADILPPPTQKQLAKMSGLSEVAVSRCLKDKNAPQDLLELYENIRTVRGVEVLYKIITYRRTGRTASLSALLCMECSDK